MIRANQTNNPAAFRATSSIMFIKTEESQSLIYGAFRLFDLIFHNTVRSIRKGHRDAVFAILASVIQTLVMVAAFYLFMSVLGLRGAAIRGDFILYIMSGIFVFMVHIKSMGAVAGAEGPTSAMMPGSPSGRKSRPPRPRPRARSAS